MIYRMLLLLVILQTVVPAIAGAQVSAAKELRMGNDYYRKQQYAKAEELYSRAAAADPVLFSAKFNQANALYKQNKQVEAAALFQELATGTAEASLLSKAWYNKGVLLSRQQNLEESITAYKNALRHNPADTEARENLQKALLELKKKSPEKKEQKKQQKEEKKQQQSPSRMDPREAEKRLRLLRQKEKEVQQRVNREKTPGAGSASKDW